MLRLPRYTLVAPVHPSGAAMLYRGCRDDDRAPVLIKLLPGERASQRDVERLRHDRAIAGELPEDVVVRPIDLVEQGRDLALIMADPGGSTLRELLAGGALALEPALRVGAALADAIEAIHRERVMHRDLRPENVLVDTATWTVRLAGFHVATRLSQQGQPLARLGALEGSLAYMAPEQTGRMYRAIDRRADLYALGVTLCEVLTGALPFAADDAAELVHGVLARTPAPPRERAPEIPEVVSDLVMKLLARSAEDRYQRAGTVARDLRECLARLAATGEIAPFPLGAAARGGALQIPHKLYGREADQKGLLDAWARAKIGRAELFLVTGPSGIGKTALVHELLREISRTRGYAGAGKFDQRSWTIPYQAMTEAFRDLCRLLLTEREASLSRWRQSILGAVGELGKVLTDLIPDLTLILGPQPSLPKVPPGAAERRFMLAAEAFLRVLTATDHPICLFVDDLQWADPASLKLLEVLLTAPACKHLLVIGAYRSGEVDAAHPLSRTLGAIAAAVKVSSIELGPLGQGDVGELVADALGAEPIRVAPLAALVLDATDGNPLFAIQLLTALHRDGLITFDPDGGCRWDEERIRARAATEDMIVFLGDRLRRLPPGTQRLLTLAACIGHRFDAETLAVIAEMEPADVIKGLWPALEDGIVSPLDTDARLVDGALAQTTLDRAARYRLAHDGFQQAAYALLDDAEKAGVHLRIGRLLRSSRGEAPGDDLFDILAHLNRGAALIGDPEERLAVARLNLEAARKAREAAALPSAVGYFAAGVSLADEAGWERAYDLLFALHLEQAECEAQHGGFDRAESLLDTVLARARSSTERAQIHSLRVVLYRAQGRNADAIDVGLEALRALGMEIHDTEEAWKPAFEAELRTVDGYLAQHPIDDLLDAPRLTDPEKTAAMRLIMQLAPAVFGIRQNLYRWTALKPVTLSITHGNSEESVQAYARYGSFLAQFLGRYSDAYPFVKLAYALSERFENRSEDCVLHFYLGSVGQYAVHWREALAHFDRAHAAGLASGDILFLSYAASQRVIARIALGDPLEEVREEACQRLVLMQRLKVASSTATLTACRQMIDNLLGRTRDSGTLSSDGFDEEAFAASIEAADASVPVCWYCTVKGELALLYEDYASAVAWLTRAARMTAMNFKPEIRFYAILAILAYQGSATAEAARELAPVLTELMTELEACARACNANYLHKHLLVQAELARVSGDDARAMALYDQAIEHAERHGWNRDVALGSELAAKLHARHGKTRVARAYVTDAINAYGRWGAIAKVRHLSARYPDLSMVMAQAYDHGRRAPSARAAMDTPDVTSFVRVLQTLSGDLVLESLLDRLLRTVLQTSGAERCVMLLEREGTLVIEATATAEPQEVRVGAPTALSDDADLAVSIVRHVERKRENVVLDDAAIEDRFARDPYIVKHRPRSIACLPMYHPGWTNVVLYLENSAATGVFTKARLDPLALLLSQAAISLENATLYAKVHAMSEQLRASNDELRDANQRLMAELAERQRAEAERAALQLEIVEAQERRLAELSTPVIPITEELLVMPLIGAMDGRRALMVLEAALYGIFRRQARIMILDITGVKDADASIAEALRRTAAAIRLLGAEVVITGIAPEVARMLVVDEAGRLPVATRSTLESGIAHALSRIGMQLVRVARR